MSNALFGGNTFNPYTNSYLTGTPSYRTMPMAPVSSVPNYTTVQPVMQSMQSMIPQSNIIWVDDVNQIGNFPTGRGWQQWFGLKNEQVIYVRETDMNGVTQPLKKVVYQLEEVPVNNSQVTEPLPSNNVDSVTRAEFDKLADSVNLMTEKLADLLK